MPMNLTAPIALPAVIALDVPAITFRGEDHSIVGEIASIGIVNGAPRILGRYTVVLRNAPASSSKLMRNPEATTTQDLFLVVDAGALDNGYSDLEAALKLAPADGNSNAFFRTGIAKGWIDASIVGVVPPDPPPPEEPPPEEPAP